MKRLLPLLSLLLTLLLAAPSARAEGLRAITALAWQGDVLWLGTMHGLARWEAGQTQALEFPLAGRAVTALLPDSDTLWVGTRDGLARRNDDGAWTQWTRGEQGLRNAWVAALARYDGAPVIGTFGGGVLRWTGNDFVPLGTGGPSQVTALAVADKSLWVGTASGLWQWDGEKWLSEQADLATRINALLIDDEGALWVGAEDGLHRRTADGTWIHPLTDERVTALARLGDDIIAATPRGLVDGHGMALPDSPTAAISALAAQGDHLAIGTLGAGLLFSPPQAASPAVLPPIVLVHGLGDSNHIEQSQLRFMAEWLTRDGYRVWYAPSNADTPLLDNVALLRQTIATAKRESGQPQVLVIAHSFGGLIAQAYLASSATDVMGLATLGTPHAGVRLVYDILVADLPDLTPSETALLPEQVVAIPMQPGQTTPQLHIGGNLLPRDTLLAGLPASDGYISAASAIAAPGATRLLPVLHGWTLDAIGGGIESMTWPDTLYHGTLLPWMQAVASGDAWTDRADSPPLPDAGFTRRPLVSEVLAPDEEMSVRVTLDAAPTTWLLEAEGIRTTLIAPDGTRYGDDSLLLTPTVARLPYEGFGAARFWSTRDRAGEWQVELRNPSDTPRTVRLSLIRPDDLTLTIRSEGWVDAEAEVAVEAQGPTGLALTATLGDEHRPMDEVSPGSYRATLRAPTRWGYHRLRVGNDDIERLAVIGVRSERFTLVEQSPDALTLSGEGQAALLLTFPDGERRLVGPYRFRDANLHRIPLAPDTDWTLFDATHDLIPVR